MAAAVLVSSGAVQRCTLVTQRWSLRGSPCVHRAVFGGALPARLVSPVFPARRHTGVGLVVRADAESPSSFATDSAPTSTQTENGAAPGEASKEGPPLPTGELVFEPRNAGQRAATSFRLIFALPWRRFKKGSVLQLDVGGAISEERQGRFASAKSVPQICGALKKAAYDPRVSGVFIKMSPLSAGWAKVQEIRRHLAFFRESGKYTMVYMAQGGEKEYYLATAAEEIYVAPTAQFSLRGFKVAGTFLRGVLDKVGVEPELVRIGKFKSAGDQLLRSDMSEPQREQLQALLDNIYGDFVATVAKGRSKSEAEVETMLNEGIYEMEKYVEGGWVTACKYEDELRDMLKERTGGNKEKIASVGLKKYSSVSPSAFGLGGKNRIAVVRASGAIVSGSGGGGLMTGSMISADGVIKQLRAIGKQKNIKAVVLRVDSPGGDALASDLMWREIQVLSKDKPVIASMSDTAASGGYYMAMAARKIVAEPLTITGSIGVITGKFNLAELYRRAGYAKTSISKGRWSELLNEERPFTDDEKAYFDQQAHHAYADFRNKAASSRGMPVDTMQGVAQGRVWSGRDALSVGLVDALGGVSTAVAIAKQAAGLGDSDTVAVLEVSRAQMSPLALLSGGASASSAAALALSMAQVLQSVLRPGAWTSSAALSVGVNALLAAVGGGLDGAGSANPGQTQAMMQDITVDGAFSSQLSGSTSAESETVL